MHPHPTEPGTFVAELRLTLGSLDDWRLLRSMLDTAGERLTGNGEMVRCVSATYLPDEGQLFCLFSAPTSDAIRKVLAAGNFASSRVLAAVALPGLDPGPEAA